MVVPLSDPERLAAIERSGLLRHGPDERLIRICYTATELLRCDISQLNILTATQQLFVAEWPAPGFERKPQDITEAGCSVVIEENHVIAVPDTREHPVMCNMPWIREWRGYLGAPVTFDGMAIGSLCALTVDPRGWTPQDCLAVQTLADMATAAIGAALTDPQDVHRDGA